MLRTFLEVIRKQPHTRGRAGDAKLQRAIEPLEPRRLLSGFFAPKFDGTAGIGLRSITSADFNHDSNLDLAVANSSSGTVSVLLTQNKVDYPVGNSPYSVIAVDINNDGYMDLAVTNLPDNTVSVLMNQGDGTFAARTHFATGLTPSCVTSGDFNRDGRADLAVVNTNSDTVSLLLGQPQGGFADKTDYPTGSHPTSATAGDFNGDGRADLAVVNNNSNTVSLLLSQPQGGFADKSDYPTGTFPYSVTTADFNGDSKLDLAVASRFSNTVNVLINQGTGTFANKVDYATGHAPNSVTWGDYNNDGKPDLAVANANSDTVSVLIGHGDGIFSEKDDYATGSNPLSVVSLRSGNPGTDGLGVINYGSDTYSLLFNRTVPVTINMGGGQNDPWNQPVIQFIVVFGSAVTGFTTGDVPLSGTAGATTATVTGSGTTYLVEVRGMTRNGTVIASIPPSVATNAQGYWNAASTSTHNTVTYDTTPPTITLNQAAAQADPTNNPTVNFTAVFSKPVVNFNAQGVLLSGTAGATTAVVTGSGTTYNIAVSGMTKPGTVIASLAAGAARDEAANFSMPSTSIDNTVTFDNLSPTVIIDQAEDQVDPTYASIVNFAAVFSEPVKGFTSASVFLSGTAGPTTAIVTGSGTTYNVAVSGMTQPGTVIARLGAGAATDLAGNASAPSTSTDNTVAFDNTPLTVTINQGVGQPDPTNSSTITFTVVFSKPVRGFGGADVTLGGTAGATTAVVPSQGPDSVYFSAYSVIVIGMTRSGTVTASIPFLAAADVTGQANAPSTSTDNTITFDNVPPTVTINQATSQADPTHDASINFTVVFSEPVIGFATGDVSLSGTAGATTATVTGSGDTYNVAVTGMTRSGTVIVAVPPNVASDAAGNLNAAYTTTDNSVTFDSSPQASLTAATITTPPKSGYAFKVTYTDDLALKASTVGTGDIFVLPPKSVRNYKPVAAWVRPKKPFANGKAITTTYSIPAPGGTWDKSGNGVYTVMLAYRQISDTSGNLISSRKSGQAIGTFAVQIGVKPSKGKAPKANALPSPPARQTPVSVDLFSASIVTPARTAPTVGEHLAFVLSGPRDPIWP